MAEIWCVLRKPKGEESPYVGPFTSREEAQEWAGVRGVISAGCPLIRGWDHGIIGLA
jgi:hypothetical protein